jgi:uncharacterized SAM-binding protein YcdF (DUF218 family)
MKKRSISKKLLFYVILLGLVILLISSYQPILIGAGRFLAPAGTGRADVVILEGGELIREKAVKIGVELLSSGRANCMVVVVHQYTEDERTFALPDYALLVSKYLEVGGLKKDQFMILGVPTRHPITFTEAQIVLHNLSKSRVKSAILLAEGFHTRRSFWTYKQVGLPLGIEITPYPYFTKCRNENWWQEVRGAREFVSEFLKFTYYLIRGYIPIKSLLVT